MLHLWLGFKPTRICVLMEAVRLSEGPQEKEKKRTELGAANLILSSHQQESLWSQHIIKTILVGSSYNCVHNYDVNCRTEHHPDPPQHQTAVVASLPARAWVQGPEEVNAKDTKDTIRAHNAGPRCFSETTIHQCTARLATTRAGLMLGHSWWS